MWREMAECLAAYLDSTPREERTAQMLNVIRCFLKDNDCAANASHKVSLAGRMDSLLSLGLPFGESGKDH